MDYKQECIQQGYVPADCKLDGMLVWLLVKEGRNPCDVCNANCVHRRYSKCGKIEFVNKEEIGHKERIQKRNALGTNSNPIVYVDSVYKDVQITTIDPNSEKKILSSLQKYR